MNERLLGGFSGTIDTCTSGTTSSVYNKVRFQPHFVSFSVTFQSRFVVLCPSLAVFVIHLANVLTRVW